MLKAKVAGLILLSLTCSCVAAPQLWAATELPDPNVVTDLGTTVVTATRNPLQETKVPQAVQVVTAEDIKNLGAYNVTSALKLAQNITIAHTGMTGNSVIMRGMSTNHVLILVDGRRVAGEDTSSTQNVHALNRLNVANIERIEIVRGSASAIYGSDAMAGVINIITKQPTAESALLGVATGTDEINNYYCYDSGKQGAWSVAAAARLTKVRKKGHYAASTSDKVATRGDDYNMYGPKQYYNIDAVYDFANANENKLRLSANYLKENLATDYADGYLQAAPSMMTSKNRREWYHNDGYGFSLEYTGETELHSYQLRSYYNKFNKESRLFNERNNFPGPMEQAIGSLYPKVDFDDAEYYTWVTEGRDTIRLNATNRLTYGGEYRKVNYEGTRLGDGGKNVHSVTVNGVTKSASYQDIYSYAFYLQDEWDASNKLFVVPSVRIDHSSSFGSELTPRLGMTYAFDEHRRVKFNIGKGYKEPTISELYMHMRRAMGSGNIDVYGNPDLQPEKSTNVDIGVEIEGKRDYGKVTYFQNWVSNLITMEYLDTTGTQLRYVNVDKAKIGGVEVELGHHLDDRWEVKTTYNWLSAIDESDGSRLNDRARHNATLQLIYNDRAPQPFTATLWNEWNYGYRYNDKDYNYNTTNLTLRKEWNRSFSTTAGLDNIFDNRVDDLFIYGRFWHVGLEWKFM